MSIPHGFYYIQSGDSLWSIARNHFGLQSDSQISECVQSLLRLNPHIREPDRIFPGRILHLGNSSGFLSDVPAEGDLLDMERELSQDPSESGLILDNWEVFQTAAETGASPPPENGLVLNHLKKLGKSALKTAEKITDGKFGPLGVSPHQWRAMEGEIVHGLNSQVRYLKNANGTLGHIPKDSRAFSMNGKVFIVKPDASGGFARFSSRVKIGKSVAKNILKPAGKAIKVIDWGVSGYNVYRDWGTPEQNRTLNRETIKTGVGLVSSSLKIGAATGVCTVLTFTTGPGGVACFITVYLAASYAESAIVDSGSDWIYDHGTGFYEKVYESDFSHAIIGN
jgi:hypothetical protein